MLLTLPAQSQLVDSGDLTDTIDSIIATMPATHNGGDYSPPDQSSLATWRDTVENILAGWYSRAHAEALTIGYQVELFTDTESDAGTVHILLRRQPEADAPHWGTFVFNTAALRSHLAIQCPHPRYDLNTGYQGVRVYQTARARAFFVSGTHRCNALEESSCDGSTTACGGVSAPYRCSDQAHVVDSTFQIATAVMLSRDPLLLVIQPHGFGQQSNDPEVIISNGTRTLPSGIDWAAAIWDALQVVDPSLTAKIGHVDLGWTRLLGTSNTQGRLINQSPDPCGTPADWATGGFVHIEQAKAGLRDSEYNWMKLANAVTAAVPADIRSRRATGRLIPSGRR